jgi:polyhydroxyalkanoate synthesis repressor PhaR
MSTAEATHNGPTVIKKYANRRLYNTGTSSYVTLEDLAEMVKQGEEFVVQDAKSGEDITRSVLTQIIFEQEGKAGQNLLPIAFLRQLIRFYGDSLQNLVPRYLELSLDSLTREQDSLRRQMTSAFGVSAIQAMEEQARANMALFFRMFTPFVGPTAAGSGDVQPDADAGSRPEPDVEARAPEAPRDSLEELRREMAEMKARLDALAGPRRT